MFSEARRIEITEKFEKSMKMLEQAGNEIKEKIESCEEKTAWMLKYLYGHMIVSDMVSVPFETYLDYAEQGVFLWENGAYRDRIPEDIFLNYILYHRINEENILPCRKLFYSQAATCLRKQNMEEDVLAANYWCASQVTYRSTDDRTLAPLTVFLNGYGRCGEESTFTTSVLRSLGIPARQVYVPRWSHCDDNHAWVEFWCDGTWKFLGACEPEQISNRGWFTNAASRAMIVHSRRFDSLDGEKEIGRDGMVVMVNQLDRYAQPKTVKVLVQKEDGTPAEGVHVVYEVVNYAEFAPIAETVTDQEGRTSFETGKGTLIVKARCGEFTAECVVGIEETDCTLVLRKEKNGDADWQELEFFAPADVDIRKAVLTEQQKQEGEALLKEAVEKRLAKMASFYQKEKADELIKRIGSSEAETYLRNAEANFEEVYQFLNGEGEQELRLQMLRELTLKDFRDVKAEVLEHHLQEAAAYKNSYPEEVFCKYLLNPRVEWESMTAYRGVLKDFWKKEEQNCYREDPEKLWNRLKEIISCDPANDYQAVVTEPKACLLSGKGNLRSVKILFAAVCRSLGIPARLNPATKEPEYYKNGEFLPADGCNTFGSLILEEDGKETWVYKQNFTVARKKEDGFETLGLEDQEWKDGIMEIRLPAGTYRIVTANRLPNGNVFVMKKEVVLEAEGRRKEILHLKEAELSQMLEKIVLPVFCVKDEEGVEIPAKELGRDKKTLWIWVEESKEPTEHILNELYERQEEFSGVDAQIICLIRSKEALQDPTFTRTRGVLPKIKVYYDSFTEYYDQVSRRMYQDPDRLPLILVTDGDMYGIYATCGYNVGTGDMLLRVLDGGKQ